MFTQCEDDSGCIYTSGLYEIEDVVQNVRNTYHTSTGEDYFDEKNSVRIDTDIELLSEMENDLH